MAKINERFFSHFSFFPFHKKQNIFINFIKYYLLNTILYRISYLTKHKKAVLPLPAKRLHI